MITALKLLQEARKRCWTFKVDQGDEPPIPCRSATKAWQMVKEVDEAYVAFFDVAGKRMGVAHLMAPGVNTCADDETLVNYSCDGGEFEALCDAMIEEAVS